MLGVDIQKREEGLVKRKKWKRKGQMRAAINEKYFAQTNLNVASILWLVHTHVMNGAENKWENTDNRQQMGAEVMRRD